MPEPTPRKPRKQTPKSNPLEIEKRVQVVLGWLSSGARRSIIIRNGKENWGIAEDTVDDYIARAKVLWQQENQVRRESAADFAFTQVMETIRQTLPTEHRTPTQQDIKLRLQALDMLNKMVGNYAPTKQEQSGDLIIRIIRDDNDQTD